MGYISAVMANDADPDLQPGAVVDRYLVEGVLGRGGWRSSTGFGTPSLAPPMH
jgi:hypothetical protein